MEAKRSAVSGQDSASKSIRDFDAAALDAMAQQMFAAPKRYQEPPILYTRRDGRVYFQGGIIASMSEEQFDQLQKISKKKGGPHAGE